MSPSPRPEVSVVIPTRSRSRLLAVALRSALGQRGVALEVVVVDDASTDDTATMIGTVGDPRVRIVFNQVPKGVSAARNRGIEEAAGEWVAFLDDDDLWAPHKLALQLNAARAAGRCWVYAGDVSIDASLTVLNGSPPPRPEEVVADLARYNSVPAGASNVVVTADALADAGPFDESLTNNEDWDMWIRLASHGFPASVSRPLVACQVHPGNASRNMPRMLQELDVLERRHGIHPDRARHLRWAAWSSLLEMRRGDALRFYGRAVAAGDLTSLGRAAIALVNPRVARLRSRGRGGSRLEDPWLEEAQAWVDGWAARE